MITIVQIVVHESGGKKLKPNTAAQLGPRGFHVDSYNFHMHFNMQPGKLPTNSNTRVNALALPESILLQTNIFDRI